MIRSILIPTDFSDNAIKASLYAAELAVKINATLYILHVLKPIADSIRQPYPLHDRLQVEIEKNRKRELAVLAKQITKIYPELKTNTQLINGVSATAIPEFAHQHEIDLIIMGTKGATGLKEIFMGSVTASTIGHSKIPVLAIPQEYEMGKPDAIVFATNHFEKKPELLNIIIEFANIFLATIHVVVFLEKNIIDAEFNYNTQQLDGYLNFLKETFPGITFKGELLEGKEFEDTIEKYDKRNEVDIIAMITYPKSFWDNILRKSAVKKMTFHSEIPVLAIPAK